MDELQRQTHLEAMALALEITIVLTVIYGALPKAKVLAGAQPSNVLFVIGVSYFFPWRLCGYGAQVNEQ